MADELLFSDDPPGPPPAVPGVRPENGLDPWRILVVDDEAEVHAATRLALARLRFKDRPVRLISAYSAAEAAERLREDPGIAMVLLDVVLETEDAGLRLVRTIREDIGNRAVRIILRTGQPGQVPEASVIVDFDINDYKSKAELTARKLFTTVVSALRAYADITALEAHRRGLQCIVESIDRLLPLRPRRPFAEAVLNELATVLRAGPRAVLCVAAAGELAEGTAATAPLVIAVRTVAGTCVVPDAGALTPGEAAVVGRAFASRQSIYGDEHAALHIAAPGSSGIVACIRTGRPLSPVDRGLADVFASQAALGFSNVALYERLREANETLEARVTERTRALEEANAKLERLATLDVLTEVWNRRHFMDLAAAEVARTRRSGRTLSVFILDLDHFKLVNDSYGHAAGDEALRVVVARARGGLRSSDLIARFGGEEFVVLLPETDGADAAMVGERVRAAIAAGSLCSGPHSFLVTTSIGVAEWAPGETTIERALMRADEALYRAKQAGRNRVVLAPPAAGTSVESGGGR